MKKVVITMFLLFAFANAHGEVISGECGTNARWSFDSQTGTLTISGTGAMFGYSDASSQPWYKYRNQVKSVNVQYGITSIGAYAFRSMHNLSSVTIASSVLSIGRYAFSYTGTETESPLMVDLPEGLESIENSCFEGSNIKSIVIPSSVKKMSDAFYRNNYLEYVLMLSSQVSTFYANGTVFVDNVNNYTIKSNDYGKVNVLPFISFDENFFEYNGRIPKPKYTNNVAKCSYFSNISAEVDYNVLFGRNAGSYSYDVPAYITYKGTSYIITLPYTYTISKAPLTMKTYDNVKWYGNDNPSFTYSCSGFKNYESESALKNVSVISPADRYSDVGYYPIIPYATADNYDIEFINATLEVMPAPLTVFVSDATKTYGDENPTFTCTFSGFRNDDTDPHLTTPFTFITEATKTSSVGEYSVTATGGECKNYSFHTTSVYPGTLTIVKAPLTAKADDAQRLYFDENPSFGISYEGFKNQDNENALTTAPTARTSATKKSKVGKYSITVSGGSSRNYNLSYKTGTLSVEKRPLTVTAKSYTRKYDENNPVFSVEYKGFVNNETETAIFSPVSVLCSATKKSNVGTYDITPSDGAADNYYFKYVSGKLTIEKADQTITWNQTFENVFVGDQVLLDATIDSDVSIEFVTNNDAVGTVYRVGSSAYLDCLSPGTITIRAQQNGDWNHNAAVRVSKTIIVQDPNGIVNTEAFAVKDVRYYSLDGKELSGQEEGLNIKVVTFEDGRKEISKVYR